jgi:hypothetical protein
MLNGDIDNSLSEKDFLGKRAAYDDGEGGDASKKQRTGQGNGGDDDDAEVDGIAVAAGCGEEGPLTMRGGGRFGGGIRRWSDVARTAGDGRYC